jgi:hypothetical protein
MLESLIWLERSILSLIALGPIIPLYSSLLFYGIFLGLTQANPSQIVTSVF